jgi:prepilin-type N-terminal cleavage/methylation domain-containing protein
MPHPVGHRPGLDAMKSQLPSPISARTPGFSLIELLVVLGVVALVALLILPRLAMTRVTAIS